MKTLVFGLDRVLLHSVERLTAPYDIKTEVKARGKQPTEMRLNIRPAAARCLKELASDFEVVVWSTFDSNVSNPMLNALDPYTDYIVFRLFRDSHALFEDKLIKDVALFANRRAEDVFIVDSSMWSAAHQLANFIPITPFTDNKDDRELLELPLFLRGLNALQHPRELLKERFPFGEPVCRNYK